VTQITQMIISLDIFQTRIILLHAHQYELIRLQGIERKIDRSTDRVISIPVYPH